MADDPPVLKYASGSPDASWLDEGVTSFSFAPRPVIVLLILLGFAACGLVGYAVLVCWIASGGPTAAPELAVGPLALVGLLPLGFGVYYVWRTFRHLANFARHPVTIEFTPTELRVRNPISWGDAPRSWPWANVRSLVLKHAGRTLTMWHAYRLELKEEGVGSVHVVYFIAPEAAATDGLHAAIRATAPSGQRTRSWN